MATPQVFITVAVVIFALGLILCAILGFTSIGLYAALPADITDPTYADKKNTADTVNNWAKIFGWVCLFGLLVGIAFAFAFK